VLVVGIGKGSQASVEEQFSKLNVGTLYIQSAPGSTSRTSLDESDLEAIRQQSQYLSDATLSVNGKSEASSAQASWPAGVVGVLDNYLALNNLTLGSGEFFQPEDSGDRTRVAVLGMDLAEILFPGEGDTVVGQTVQLAGRKFDVIGVMNQAGDATQGVNMDESVLIPYGTAIKYVTGTDAKPRITAVASDVNVVQDAIMEINDILWLQHEGDASAFIVKDAGSKLVAAQDSAKTMSVLLISVAAIVLLVGGIGIMNVLFVSVKERTREIGVLKALGAKRRDILLQFLFESILISTAGGGIGLLLGSLMMPLMYLLDVTVIPSVYGNVLALIFSIATGTFFGYYPAVKAASLHPIDALRQE
jgi:putative ABC transport system permease protein